MYYYGQKRYISWIQSWIHWHLVPQCPTSTEKSCSPAATTLSAGICVCSSLPAPLFCCLLGGFQCRCSLFIVIKYLCLILKLSHGYHFCLPGVRCGWPSLSILFCLPLTSKETSMFWNSKKLFMKNAFVWGSSTIVKNERVAHTGSRVVCYMSSALLKLWPDIRKKCG